METHIDVSKKKIKVTTDFGTGKIDSLWISDLGYVMVKVYFGKSKTFINFNLTTIEELLGKKDSPVMPV